MDDHREGIRTEKLISRGSHREDIQADKPEPPWERPGCFRMDYEPHRGGLLELMGLASIIAGILSILIPFPVVAVGLPLALTTWLMARSDLAKMHKGLMDPYGEGPTIGARTASLTGLVLNLLSVGSVLLAFLVRT